MIAGLCAGVVFPAVRADRPAGTGPELQRNQVSMSVRALVIAGTHLRHQHLPVEIFNFRTLAVERTVFAVRVNFALFFPRLLQPLPLNVAQVALPGASLSATAPRSHGQVLYLQMILDGTRAGWSANIRRIRFNKRNLRQEKAA
jgi:hypothetical protein